MNASTDIAKLTARYGERTGRFNPEVTRALENVFAPILLRSSRNGISLPEGVIPRDPEKVADKLAWILFNHSRAAALATPDAEALVRLRARLLEFVQRGMAIE